MKRGRRLLRVLRKSLLGGGLVFLLALSASPAIAVDEESGSDAKLGVVDTELPQVGSGGGEVTAEDSGAPTDPTGAEETPVEEVTVEEDAQVTVEEDAEVTVEEVEELPVAQSPEQFTEVPDTIALDGRVVLLPSEPSVEQPGEQVGGGVLIGTDDGSFIPVDPASFGSALQPEAPFSGTATLSESVRAELNEQLRETGSLSREEVMQAVVETTAETAEVLPVTGAVEAEPLEGTVNEGGLVASAPGKKRHTVDVVYFTGSYPPYNQRRFTEGQLKNLVSQAGTYWKGQTNGAVTGLSVNKYKRVTAKYKPCSQKALWTQAAQSLGTNAKTYTNGRHLLVFVDALFGCNMSGWAEIMSDLHSGGQIWVDIGSWGGSDPSASQQVLNRSLATLAHEFGHNFSLGHAQSRVCSGTTTDARTVWQDDEQNKGVLRVRKPGHGSGCEDVEYGDSWNVMGGSRFARSQPTALGLAQRTALGVNPAGSVKIVKPTQSRKTQTFVLDAIGGNRGVRGLRIQGTGGEETYVEYRTLLGQDSQNMGGGSSFLSFDGKTLVSPGVEVTKSYPVALGRMSDGSWRHVQVKRSSALTSLRYGKKYLNLVSGGSSVSIDSSAKVFVKSISGGKATVQIMFTPYTDIAYSYTHYAGVHWMAQNGYAASGPRALKYHPASSTSRGAFATMLMRMRQPNYSPSPGLRLPFRDVKNTDTHYRGIAWMYENGYAAWARTFHASRPVTRGAMATFMQRSEAPNYTPSPGLRLPFRDVKNTDTHYRGIAWMYENGYAAPANSYSPLRSTTRGAMATFLKRIYD